jgi:hypothetical protein
MDEDLRPRRASRSAAQDSPTPGVAPWSEEGAHEEVEVSPYLDERLALASDSISRVGEGLRAIDERWKEVRVAAERLEEELGNATRELDHLRSQAAHRSALPVPTTAGVDRVAAPVLSPTSPAGSVATARLTPYGAYTIDRYNRTIGAVKARRRSLAAWTLVLAVAVSGALLTLTLLAREPAPPIWLAVLPTVWLIPVPFFVVSFLATQRVVRRNHLDLPGGS